MRVSFDDSACSQKKVRVDKASSVVKSYLKKDYECNQGTFTPNDLNSCRLMSVDFELKTHDVRVPTRRRLNLIPLIGTIFFIVCGGAYGLEPLVGAVGPVWALTLIVLKPLLWSFPIALMVAELSSALPVDVTGGIPPYRETQQYVRSILALLSFKAFQSDWVNGAPRSSRNAAEREAALFIEIQ